MYKPRATIIHIINGLEIGGAERALFNLLTNGLEGPFRNHVVSLMGLGHYGPRLIEAGLPVTCLHMKRGTPTLPALRRLRTALRLHRAEIVQGWMYHGNLAATVGRALFSREAILAWNIRLSLEGSSHVSTSTRIAVAAGARLSGGPRAIVYNSRRSHSQHESRGFDSERGIYIPNGFDVLSLTPNALTRISVRAEFDLQDDVHVIGYVARGHPQKDFPNLLRAFEKVIAKRPRVFLVAVGRNLDCFGVLPNQVMLTGERDDVSRLLQGFDLLCLSSRVEGFPNVIGEAMATGIPCVSTDVGDSATVVGDTGWVVPPGDSDALAQALIAAVDTPREDLRARGSAARARIEARFSITSVVERYVALYQHLIDMER